MIDAFLEEIEENKFLFALYKALHAITFLNIRSFCKIIPVLCLFGVLIFDGYLYLKKNTKFIPAVCDQKGKIFIQFYEKFFLEELFENGKLEIPINSRYKDVYCFIF